MRFAVFLALAATTLCAQGMGNMNDSGMYLMNLASGTAGSPLSAPMPMIMTSPGAGWQAMFMGSGFIVDTQESGPRGGDKLFSTNWFMGAFQHSSGPRRRLKPM